MSVVRRLASSDEDNISLACVCIVVLKKEKIVDTVVAQGRGLDNHAYWSSQCLLNNEVLLAADLRGTPAVSFSGPAQRKRN
jgi:hypothetical protein